MSKPYYRMTLKELLDFLSAPEDEQGDRPTANRPRIQFFNGGINGSLGARVDTETQRLAVQKGGIHPPCLN